MLIKLLEKFKSNKTSFLNVLVGIAIGLFVSAFIYLLYNLDSSESEKNMLILATEWNADDIYGKIIPNIPTICYRKKGTSIEVYEFTFNKQNLTESYGDSIRNFIKEYLPIYHPSSMLSQVEEWKPIKENGKVGGLIVSTTKSKGEETAKFYLCFSKGVSEKNLNLALKCFTKEKIFVQHVETFEVLPSQQPVFRGSGKKQCFYNM